MNKSKLGETLKDAIEQYTGKLVEGLANVGVIARQSNNSNQYIVTDARFLDINILTDNAADFLAEVEEFKSITTSIYHNLFPTASSEQKRFSEILYTLSAAKVFSSDWKNKAEILDYLDQPVMLKRDEDARRTLQKLMKENAIDLFSITRQALEFYGVRKAVEFFSSAKYTKMLEPSDIDSHRYDLILTNETQYYGKILFESKVRRGKDIIDSNLVLQCLKSLSEYPDKKNWRVCFYLIVFTNEPFDSRDFLITKFANILRSIDGYSEEKGNLVFSPVDLKNLHLITLGFEHFKKEFIEGIFEKTFQNFPPPPDFPGRNDDFYNRVFDIRRFAMTIKIDPAQSKYWRFGCRFSTNDNFGFEFNERHAKNEFIDIHLAAGNVDEKLGSESWRDAHLLSLVSYHAESNTNSIQISTMYKKNFVTMSLKYSHKDILNVMVSYGDEPPVERKYDLNGHYYFKLFAWADLTDFLLKTTITTVRI